MTGGCLTGMIKESQDEIMELSQPFKVIFENSVQEVSSISLTQMCFSIYSSLRSFRQKRRSYRGTIRRARLLSEIPSAVVTNKTLSKLTVAVKHQPRTWMKTTCSIHSVSSRTHGTERVSQTSTSICCRTADRSTTHTSRKATGVMWYRSSYPARRSCSSSMVSCSPLRPSLRRIRL